MEYRTLGASGLKVPVLSFGTATFGGGNAFFKAWGNTDVEGAKQMVGLCMDAGVNLFDTANVYSLGRSEEILGEALKGLRNRALISTKATFPMSERLNDYSSSRYHSCRQPCRNFCAGNIKRFFVTTGFSPTPSPRWRRCRGRCNAPRKNSTFPR